MDPEVTLERPLELPTFPWAVEQPSLVACGFGMIVTVALPVLPLAGDVHRNVA
jgi:hypothetical protein